ncbi:sodium:proton antiporter [Photobacterium sagamiensis]|uniref:Na+/H+ antiporter NhaC family protein n=1 Tax=Photobacterium sagamiensis TaxID=2910241 RepID=UPI003D098516
MNTWLTLCPPLLAITLAIVTRQAYLSIFSGILAGTILLNGSLFVGVTQSFDAIATTFTSISAVKSLIFITMIAAIINVLQQSGAIQKAIYSLTVQRNIVNSKRSAQLLTFLTGFLMCLEGIGSMMIVGLVGRPLFAKHNVSKAKLALVANSTGSPLAWLLPISGAGVFLSSLLAIQIENGVLTGKPMDYVFSAVSYQYYTILVLASVPFLAICQHDFKSGPHDVDQKNVDHKNVAQGTEPQSAEPQNHTSIAVLMLPLILLLGSIIVITLVTGDGNPAQGNVGDAIYWSGFISLFGSALAYQVAGIAFSQYMNWVLDGFKQILPAVIILVLAFTLSNIIGQLGTGTYLAGLVSEQFSLWVVPSVVFIIGMLISFSTGSSGATVSILIPIGISMAVNMGIPVPMMIGAVISGAVFGDQSSPISDSIIVASSAADCEPELHFRTQLPFTLLFATLSVIGYLIIGTTV